jgi:predicted transcriptional regulator
VKKTSVYLEPELDRALERLAARRHVSKAEAIRQALRQAVSGAPRPRVQAIGIAEGPGDVAGDVDRHLRETRFGE